MAEGVIDQEEVKLREENEMLWNWVKFLYPYAMEAPGITMDKYPATFMHFQHIKREIKEKIYGTKACKCGKCP